MENTFKPEDKLMALSWKQPYANLMLQGKIETRTWNTNVRGWVLICASKTMYKFDIVKQISGPYQLERIKKSGAYGGLGEFGMAIAIGKLVDSRPMQKDDEDKCFVEYHPDLFCHVYENVQAIKPFPWKGSQGWKEVPLLLKSKIQFI